MRASSGISFLQGSQYVAKNDMTTSFFGVSVGAGVPVHLAGPHFLPPAKSLTTGNMNCGADTPGFNPSSALAPPPPGTCAAVSVPGAGAMATTTVGVVAGVAVAGVVVAVAVGFTLSAAGGVAVACASV